MSLKVNLRHLEEHGIRLQGELPVAKLDLGVEDELVHAEKPLRYDLAVELLHHAVLATGSLAMTLDCECARCLKKFKTDLKLAGWAVHLPLEGEEKVSVDNDCVDLTPFVREDILLNFPQHPLCKTDCAGLKPKSKAPRAGGDKTSKPAVWAELDKLKLK
ncbi:MAG TPA: YceD family protein [Candidatus Binatia bacterium]|nr:YceD family protein [Candidatus Binatia bacterium]